MHQRATERRGEQEKEQNVNSRQGKTWGGPPSVLPLVTVLACGALLLAWLCTWPVMYMQKGTVRRLTVEDSTFKPKLRQFYSLRDFKKKGNVQFFE